MVYKYTKLIYDISEKTNDKKSMILVSFNEKLQDKNKIHIIRVFHNLIESFILKSFKTEKKVYVAFDINDSDRAIFEDILWNYHKNILYKRIKPRNIPIKFYIL